MIFLLWKFDFIPVQANICPMLYKSEQSCYASLSFLSHAKYLLDLQIKSYESFRRAYLEFIWVYLVSSVLKLMFRYIDKNNF